MLLVEVRQNVEAEQLKQAFVLNPGWLVWIVVGLVELHRAITELRYSPYVD